MWKHLDKARILVAAACVGSVISGTAVAQVGGIVGDGLKVLLSEWSIGFASANVDDGELTVNVSNDGSAQHNLVIESAAGRRYVQTPLLNPGESRTLSVELPAGTYNLYCSVPGHRPAGMEATLTVGAADEPQVEEGGGQTDGGGGYY
ncbi:MAG: hypothetical protein GWN84_16150 [Gammaproteobacteria bacterium]|nr:hypothetical protein [Gammaproteobacteria bacterium]NIR84320.1 hypothetical protein [Gammaproteobacteria bacterium]NIR89836.1 hypothetical protein [Gammaproteobacteria bacterium]NIU05703.1 hypothetical protein [Gammaproteobacteria bacterium]NIV52463.1 hypothetical protein [Gammaproteobacteria bacterium]